MWEAQLKLSVKLRLAAQGNALWNGLQIKLGQVSDMQHRTWKGRYQSCRLSLNFSFDQNSLKSAWHCPDASVTQQMLSSVQSHTGV